MRTRFCLIVIVSLVGAMAALPGYCSVPDLNAQPGLGPTLGGMKSPVVSSYDIGGPASVNNGLMRLAHDIDLREVDWTRMQEKIAAEKAETTVASDDTGNGDDEEADEDENGGDEEEGGEEGGWDRVWDAPKLG